MKNEVWKDVPNYEGIYKVSNFGRIKMVKRTLIDSLGKKINKKEHILKPRTGNRYYMIALYKNGKREDLLLHRLIAQTFIPNPENKPFVNHKDENCFNNCSDNLMWCTQKENMNWGTINERMSKNSKSKRKVNQYDMDGNFIKQWDCMTDFYKSKGLKLKTGIIECCKGRRQSHMGYKWKYADEDCKNEIGLV